MLDELFDGTTLADDGSEILDIAASRPRCGHRYNGMFVACTKQLNACGGVTEIQGTRYAKHAHRLWEPAECRGAGALSICEQTLTRARTAGASSLEPGRRQRHARCAESRCVPTLSLSEWRLCRQAVTERCLPRDGETRRGTLTCL